MSPFVLDPIKVDGGWSGRERVLHNALYDHIVARFPRALVSYEERWPGVGRPDLILTTDLGPAGLSVAIIEVKRHIANDAAARQLLRYYLHEGRTMRRLGVPAHVTGILAAPHLRLERTRLSPELLYLPLVVG